MRGRDQACISPARVESRYGRAPRPRPRAYIRTSSAANVGADKDSDKRQRLAISSFAKRAGYDLVGEFTDAAVSGAAGACEVGLRQFYRGDAEPEWRAVPRSVSAGGADLAGGRAPALDSPRGKAVSPSDARRPSTARCSLVEMIAHGRSTAGHRS